MRLLHRVAELSAALDAERAAGRTVGLVPTMGALHAGHRSLVERAASECDVVAVTIFVNPLQFGPNEDLDRYPRSLDADVALVGGAGAALVLAPSVEELYGTGSWTTVHVGGAMTEVLEGARRPGHFDGVATVVAKLFAMTGRCRAYFGEKDWQQLAVVRRMAHDLSFPVEVVPCPTVRDDDGLALSSRNAYLGADERARATALHRALSAGLAAVEAGDTDPVSVRARMAEVIEAEPLFELDYAEVVDADDLQVPDPLTGSLRLLVAARLRSGAARLIDNLGATIPAPTNPKDA
ncbi:MAG: pantoate--beta-alanine ligase [Acidimicrobiia bacterium]